MKKHSFKLEFYFSLVIFGIMTASVAIIAPLFILARSRGFFNGIDLFISASIFYGFSIIAGVLISAIVGKRILEPIKKLSAAAKKVAEGDFSVRLEEKSRVDELSRMARDFNLMVQELGNTATFREDFIDNLSHEFKTPLASIEGYAVLLRDSTLSDAERYDYADRICGSARRLSKLSGNILKISQLEGMEIVPDKKKFRLDEQLREAVLLLETEWSRKELDLDVELSETVYYGNRDLLMHVWMNILSNAVKFTPDGGSIGVSLETVDGCALCTVSDSGIGMEEAQLRHVFDKFYQADTSRKGEGNGLGLTLAARVVKLCGGTITAQSEPGKGTSFTVTLPL